MPRTVSGPFVARGLGAGIWRLTTNSDHGAEVYLRGTGPEAAQIFAGASFEVLGVEWRADDVKVTLTGANGAGLRLLTAHSVLIHEPNGRLYECLPLASFDAEAQRFWKRVFRLLRIPGGKLLLRFVARRKRARG